MRERLPRRHDAAAKFFRQIIANEKIGIRVRFQAALRLTEVLLEHDRAQNRREIAQERAAVRQSGAPEPSEPEEPEVPRKESAHEAAERFLTEMKEKYGDRNNG